MNISPNSFEVDGLSETNKCSVSILSAFGTYYFFVRLFFIIYRPSIRPFLDKAERILSDIAWNESAPNPLPFERTFFYTAYLAVPLLLVGYYFLVSKVSKRWPTGSKKTNGILSAAALIFLVWAMNRVLTTPVEAGGPSNWNVYFGSPDVVAHSVFHWSCWALWAVVFLSFDTIRNWMKPGLMRFLRNFLVMYPAFFLLLIFLKNVGYFPGNLHHFNAVYYSMGQVYSGSPMLVDHFTNTYGLYPHFLMPFFKLTALDIRSFSAIMSFLLVMSFVFLISFLRTVVKNPLLLFLGITSVIWSYLMTKLSSNDSYFQYTPIRLVFPYLSLVLVAQYIRKPSGFLYYLSFLIYSMSILWNPDTGMVVFAAWLLLLCFMEVPHHSFSNSLYRSTLHMAKGFATLAVSWGFYAVLIRALYGARPHLMSLFSVALSFSQLGLFNLSLPIVHAWNLYVVCGSIGLMICISDAFQRRIDERTHIIFYVALLSLGLLSYYQRRSHPSTFFATWGNVFLLLTLYADRLWANGARCSGRASYPLKALFLYCLFFIGFACVSLASEIPTAISRLDLPKFPILMSHRQVREEAIDQYLLNYTEIVRFIRKNTTRGEKIIIWGYFDEQGIYFSGTDTVSAFNPGEVDLFFKSDEDRLIATLNSGQYKLFINPALLSSYAASSIHLASYQIEDRSPSMVYLTHVKAQRIFLIRQAAIKTEWPLPAIAKSLIRDHDRQEPFVLIDILAKVPDHFRNDLKAALAQSGLSMSTSKAGDPTADFTEFVLVKKGETGIDDETLRRLQKWDDLQKSGRSFTRLFHKVVRFPLSSTNELQLYQRDRTHHFDVEATVGAIESRLLQALHPTLGGIYKLHIEGSPEMLKEGHIHRAFISGGPLTIRHIEIPHAEVEIEDAWLNLYQLWDHNEPGLLEFGAIRVQGRLTATDAESLLLKEVKIFDHVHVHFYDGRVEVEARYKTIPIKVVASITAEQDNLRVTVHEAKLGPFHIPGAWFGRAEHSTFSLEPNPSFPGRLKINHLTLDHDVLSID